MNKKENIYNVCNKDLCWAFRIFKTFSNCDYLRFQWVHDETNEN